MIIKKNVTSIEVLLLLLIISRLLLYKRTITSRHLCLHWDVCSRRRNSL